MKNNVKGYLLVLSAAIFWGVSGTFAQYLFNSRHLDLEWLVTTRLLVSGIILLLIASFRHPVEIIGMWKTSLDRFQLLLFSIFGMLGVQFTYFAAIKASNAATATVLQYLGPVMIAVYFSMRNRKLPMIQEIFAILLAVVGTFLLVTHGNPGTLSISPAAITWGICSAFALAFYSIQPMRLLKKWGAGVLIGWGMLISGLLGCLVHAPWKVPGNWDIITILMLSFIIIFATVIAFHAYLVSITLIGATRASIIACAEPLAAAILGVTWLRTPFGVYDWLGTVMIVSTILLLAWKGRHG